jgi:hypothetical protein
MSRCRLSKLSRLAVAALLGAAIVGVAKPAMAVPSPDYGVGGAPLYVSACTDFNGCVGLVNIDQWPIANAGSAASDLNRLPANSTFLRVGRVGAFYRVAGGYPFALTNCKIIGGCKHPVIIDPWDVSHLRNPLTHLRSTPRNGTIVRCYPSRRYWSFKYGKRHHSAPSTRAVSVDDSSVTHFPL